MDDPIRVKLAVSLGSGVVRDTDSVDYTPTTKKSRASRTKKWVSKRFKGLRKQLSAREKQPSTLSTAASSLSDSSHSVSADSTSPQDRGLAVFRIEDCSEEELFGGEVHLLDRSVELQGIRKMIAELSTQDKRELTDPKMVIRHFRAEKGDLKKALKSLRAALEWRRKYEVDRLRTCMPPHRAGGDKDKVYSEMIERETQSGKLYVRGTTKEGRALLYMYAMKNATPNAEHDNMKHLVWNIEKAASVTNHHSKGRLDKYCLMIDCSNYKLSKAPSLSASKFTLDVLQKHYPERMYRAYVLNAPAAFRLFWNLVKNFIDPVTKAKVVFVTADSSGLQQMYDDIGPENSEKLEASAFGKKLPVRDFDPNEYLNLPMHVSFDE